MKIIVRISGVLLISILIQSCKKESENVIKDIDGNVYSSITIGSQVWMGENLKTTKYSNGNLIGTTIPPTLNIYDEAAPKYQWVYDSNNASYGRLYTWYAVTDIRNVCPTGWHVPSYEDWSTLITYLGGADAAGGKLKENGTTHWLTPNTGATNETGFGALPAGGRNEGGQFNDIGTHAYWWSSSESSADMAYPWYTYNQGSGAYPGNTYKVDGLSVRCLKDN
jgi:uncharacterized protein (TIGR02145 family)